ncbi:hypothetical protein L6E12_32445 [Actinokineospora sp. PR83]|nr:hypothetical protein [Actinokineospora sp. PR83]MCG8920487.1 hypothetical protein [Actinokineospora sp. PR83]
MRRPFPGRSFVRAAMLIPCVAPVVAAGLAVLLGAYLWLLRRRQGDHA